MWTRFRIGPRIYLGYTLAAFLLIGVGLLAVLQLRSTAENIDWLVSDLQQYADGIQNLEKHILALTANASTRIETGQDQELKQAKYSFDQVHRSLGRIEATSDKVAGYGIRSDVNKWRDTTNKYWNIFEKADELSQENHNSQETFRSSGSRIANLSQDAARKAEETYYDALYSDESNRLQRLFGAVTQFSGVERLILQVRVIERNFVATHDFSELNNFENMLDNLEHIITRLAARARGDQKDLVNDVGTALADYRQAATAWIDNTRELAALQKELRQASRSLTQDARAVANEAAERARELGHDTIGDARKTINLIAASAAGSLAALIVFAFLISRSIVPPLRSFRQSMIDLAEGNLEIEIVGSSRKDEIGDMAQSVEAFKQNSIKAREEELESQRRREQESRQKEQEILNEMAGKLRQRVEDAVKSLNQQNDNLRLSSASMSEGASRTSERTATATKAVVAAAEKIQSVANATEELRATSEQIGVEIQKSSDHAESAANETKRTQDIVESLVIAGDNIDEVVRLIKDIA